MSEKTAGITMMKIDKIHPSKTNPRKYFDEAAHKELTENVKTHGVLQPILVRKELKGTSFEIVAGERRFRAAKAADFKEMPVIERDFTDAEVLEIQVIENIQREGLTPLEEAQGYLQLIQLPKPHNYDAAKLADRLGRSIKYVYDRIKLLELIEPAKKLLKENKITAGHAILLARLKGDDQKRAIADDTGGLWQNEYGLYNPNDEGDEENIKTRSVRELQAWIDDHVKFDPKKDADPMLFPDLVMAVKTASVRAEKIVPITHDAVINDDARDGEKVVGPRSWTRADGKKDSETCEYSAVGVFVVGPSRGESLRVCTNKDKCKIHWGELIRGREQREKEKEKAIKSGKPVESVRDTRAQDEQRRKDHEAKEQVALTRWKKALPAILTAMAEAVKKKPAKASGQLAEIILDRCQPGYSGRGLDLTKYMPLGTSAEDLIRHCAFLQLADEASQDWSAPKTFAKTAKEYGVDIGKILMESNVI